VGDEGLRGGGNGAGEREWGGEGERKEGGRRERGGVTEGMGGRGGGEGEGENGGWGRVEGKGGVVEGRGTLSLKGMKPPRSNASAWGKFRANPKKKNLRGEEGEKSQRVSGKKGNAVRLNPVGHSEDNGDQGGVTGESPGGVSYKKWVSSKRGDRVYCSTEAR